jgi:hypothetical protein
MGSMGHVARKGGLEKRTKFKLRSLREEDHSEELGIDGKITKIILRANVWIGFIWLRVGTSGGLL